MLKTGFGNPVTLERTEVVKDTARSLMLRCRVIGREGRLDEARFAAGKERMSKGCSSQPVVQ